MKNLKKILTMITILSITLVFGLTKNTSASSIVENSSSNEQIETTAVIDSNFDNAPILYNNQELKSSTSRNYTERFYKVQAPSYYTRHIGITVDSKYKNHEFYVYDEDLREVGSDTYGVLVQDPTPNAWYYIMVWQESQTIYTSNPFKIKAVWE